ncbi:MAG: type II CRISPR RNA-guided endonuclease Cas9, partial [Planctomycetota bacterium]
LTQILPYYLRKKALKNKLEPFEIGRALYHLAQHRGFQSYKKQLKKETEEEKKKSSEEQQELPNDVKQKLNKGELTLCEYFCNFDITNQRIRTTWTAREWYDIEFNKIWDNQSKFYFSLLTDSLKKEIWNTIFFFRPLKPPKYVYALKGKDPIGDCQFEENEKRAPMALPSAQKFRYLQKVNNLRITIPKEKKRELKVEEREKLIKELDTKSKITLAAVKNLLGYKRNVKFNFEDVEGDEKEIEGNDTVAKLSKCFGNEKLISMPLKQQDEIVETILKIQDDTANYYWDSAVKGIADYDKPKERDEIIKYGKDRLGLSEENAIKLSNIDFEEGYCNLSCKAIGIILPELEKGISYSTIIKDKYGIKGLNLKEECKSRLEPVVNVIGDLRNPTVMRAMTELKKVVNAIVKEYGKPDKIRIEIIRDLKKNRAQRENTSKIIEHNRKERVEAKTFLATKGISPTKENIDKYILGKESVWSCPYCGYRKQYDFDYFKIDHIIPYSRSFDDSFLNKTLCCDRCNNYKLNRTPFEAYGNTPEWEKILDRVDKFCLTKIPTFRRSIGKDKGKKIDITLGETKKHGKMVKEKLRRFQLQGKELEEYLNDFANSQFTNTAYISRKAVEYIGQLYGKDAKKHVQVLSGGITKDMRNALNLNSILKDGIRKDEENEKKERIDHRHHAVDAVAIALTTPENVAILSREIFVPRKEKWAALSKRVTKQIAGENFFYDVKDSIDNIKVSHRVSKKVSGALHEETFYSPPRDKYGYKSDDGEYTFIRKKIESIDKKDIENIVAPVIRECVRKKVEELGGGEPNKIFKDRATHPTMSSGVPIHKVRLRVKLQIRKIAKDERVRYVKTGNNHHVEIWKETDKKGKVKWDGDVISLMDAVQRKKNNEPIVKRDFGEGKEFVCSLAFGEIVELKEPDGTRKLYRVRTVPKMKQLSFVRLNDARKKKDILTSGDWKTSTIDPLFHKLECQKVVITPLGEVRRAND